MSYNINATNTDSVWLSGDDFVEVVSAEIANANVLKERLLVIGTVDMMTDSGDTYEVQIVRTRDGVERVFATNSGRPISDELYQVCIHASFRINAGDKVSIQMKRSGFGSVRMDSASLSGVSV